MKNKDRLILQEVGSSIYLDDCLLFNADDLITGSYFMQKVVGPSVRNLQLARDEYEQSLCDFNKLLHAYPKYLRKAKRMHKEHQENFRRQLFRWPKEVEQHRKVQECKNNSLTLWVNSGSISELFETSKEKGLNEFCNVGRPLALRTLLQLVWGEYQHKLRYTRKMARAIVTTKNLYDTEERNSIFLSIGWTEETAKVNVAQKLLALSSAPPPRPCPPGRFRPLMLPQQPPRKPNYMSRPQLPPHVEVALQVWHNSSWEKRLEECNWYASADNWKETVQQRPHNQELTYLLDAYKDFVNNVTKYRTSGWEERKCLANPYNGYGKLAISPSLRRASMDWYLYNKDTRGSSFVVSSPPWISRVKEWQPQRLRYDRWFIRPYWPTSDEYKLTEQLRHEFVQAGFNATESLPKLLISEELQKGEMTPDTCGNYFPVERSVVLYDRVLMHAPHVLKASITDCRALTYIHEMAHWFTHAVPHWDTGVWKLHDFNATDNNVIEGLAQLMTYWCIRESPALLSLFLRWDTNLPAEYQAWQKFRNHTHASIIHAIIRMRTLRRPAQLADLVEFSLQEK